MIIAVRTPPCNSWKDLAERIMSILNLALQAVGLMRQPLQTDELEESIKKCSGIKRIRNLANEEVKHEVLESMKAAKSFSKELFESLTLKEKQFKVNEAATKEAIDNLWTELGRIDGSVSRNDTTKCKNVFNDFLHSHCIGRHYMFSVKKMRPPRNVRWVENPDWLLPYSTHIIFQIQFQMVINTKISVRYTERI